MNINEVMFAKYEMEGEIRIAVHQAVKAFHVKTGLSPSAIIIDLVDMTSISHDRMCLVGEVHCIVFL